MKVVSCQPYSAEVTPAKFLKNYIAINQDFADVDWMVSTNLVVCDALVFRLVAVTIQLVLGQIFFECLDLMLLLLVFCLLLFFVLSFALFLVFLVSLVRRVG